MWAIVSVRVYLLNLKYLHFIILMKFLWIQFWKVWSLSVFLRCLLFMMIEHLISHSLLDLNVFCSSLQLRLFYFDLSCCLLHLLKHQNLNRDFNKDDFFDLYFFYDFYGLLYLNNLLNYYLIRYLFLWLYIFLFRRLVKGHKRELF